MDWNSHELFDFFGVLCPSPAADEVSVTFFSSSLSSSSSFHSVLHLEMLYSLFFSHISFWFLVLFSLKVFFKIYFLSFSLHRNMTLAEALHSRVRDQMEIPPPSPSSPPPSPNPVTHTHSLRSKPGYWIHYICTFAICNAMI